MFANSAFVVFGALRVKILQAVMNLLPFFVHNPFHNHFVTVRSYGYNTLLQCSRCNGKYANYKLGTCTLL